MNQSIGTILTTVKGLLNFVIPMLITLIVIFTIFKALQFARGKEMKEREEARKGMIAGVIALAVVLSLFGIVRVLQNSVLGGGVNNTTTGQGLITPVIQ